MAKLAVWNIDAQSSEGDYKPSCPKKVEPSNIELEKYLEDWIVNDVSMIGEGLTLVGRQVRIDDGVLDLLAIDSRDRWVVIELKADMLYSGAVTQAIYYASSLSQLSGEDLHQKLENQFFDEEDFRRKVGYSFDTPQAHSAKVKKQVDNEGEVREIALMIVGAGVSPGVERMSKFLGRFGIPIEIVSFEVFESNNGARLLVREVIEEAAPESRPKRKYTVEAVRELARKADVEKHLDRFLDMTSQAGLAIQPQMTSIRIAPQEDRRRLLLYVEPIPDDKGANEGKLLFYWDSHAFEEFFKIGEQEVRETFDELGDERALSGEAIDKCLNQIQRFLKNNFPRAHVGDA